MAFRPSDRKLTSLSQLVFTLARYDLDYDVRDRARMLSSLVTTPTLPHDQSESRGGVVLRREQVQLVLYCGKSAVVDEVRRAGPFTVPHLLPMIHHMCRDGESCFRLSRFLDWQILGSESFPSGLARRRHRFVIEGDRGRRRPQWWKCKHYHLRPGERIGPIDLDFIGHTIYGFFYANERTLTTFNGIRDFLC
jgi:hypothetical protein